MNAEPLQGKDNKDMAELTLSKVKDRFAKGCNPIEVAGYGREATHKGYLTWLLNTWHWSGAREGLKCLVKGAKWPSDSRREDAKRWIHNFPKEFWCEYERRVGNGKVDLLVQAEYGSKLPIELKTDSVARDGQLKKMSSDQENYPFGLILCFGSSAVRDDRVDKYGCFALVTLDAILDAWNDLISSMPRPGRDWIESLRHEKLRLTNAFDLTPDQREQWWDYGYRADKHPFYALLSSVRKILNDKHDDLGTWKLYDGGYNTVLNLVRGDWSWRPVAGGNAEFYWEFNNKDLFLKVHPCEDRDEQIAREWVEKTKEKVREGYPGFKEGIRAQQVRRERPQSISVVKWKLKDNFSTAHCVADRAADIIRQCSCFL